MQFYEQFRYTRISNLNPFQRVTPRVSFLELSRRTYLLQAARKTADNAVHLRRVDEKVDRAVAAANKAATAARVAAVKAVQNRIHRKFCDTNS